MSVSIDAWVAGLVGSLAIVAWAVERVAAAWRDHEPLVLERDDEDGDCDETRGMH